MNQTGIKNGFIITKIDKSEVSTIDELKMQLKKIESEGILIEGIYPNGMKAYYAIGK